LEADNRAKETFEVFLKEKLQLPVAHGGKQYEFEDFHLESPEPLVNEYLVGLVNDYFAGSEFQIKIEIRSACHIGWSIEKDNIYSGQGVVTNYSDTETKLIFVTIEYKASP
jgi:hypothetical protein